MSVSRVIVLILLLLNSACVKLSPDLIQAGGNDYNIAMQGTRNEQMLLNLVRLKYRDTPYFLEAGSVSSQFSLSSGASASADLGTQPVTDSIGLSGQIAYTEAPTVTYLPLSGNDFIQRMLVPVSLDTIILLANSGWSLERVLRLTVDRINGIPNAPRASGPTPGDAPVYEEFLRAVQTMEDLRKQDRISLAYKQTGDDNQAVLAVDEKDENDVLLQQLQNQLKLNPDLDEYPLHAGKSVTGGDAIVVSTRSLQGILYYLSHSVDVPESDKNAGVVTRSYDAQGNEFVWSQLTNKLFRVHNGTGENNAAVATTYRGHRFYIDDSDLDSKSTFSLLMQLFSLQAGEAEGVAPVLTIPVGG